MIIKNARLRRPPLVAFAVAVALLVAACGSSSSTTSTAKTASAGSSRAKLTACLKRHGVTLPTGKIGKGKFGGAGKPSTGAGKPPTGAGTGTVPSGTGTRPTGSAPGFSGGSSKLRTALKACGDTRGTFAGHGAFHGKRGNFRPSYSATTLAAFRKCVAKHGYTLPKANTSGKGSIFPRSIESNAKFKKASAKCASLLHAAPGPGTSSTSSTTSSS